MHVIGCLILLFIIAVVLIILIPAILINLVHKLFSFVRNLFGIKPKNSWGNTTNKSHQQQHENYTSSTQQKRKEGKKIFERNEGEYVDFEEVKD